MCRIDRRCRGVPGMARVNWPLACSSRSMSKITEASRDHIADENFAFPKLLAKRVILLKSIRGVGEVTALTWALEVSDPQRFSSVARAVSYCGLTSALISSADKQQRGPISKQRNAHLQTVLIEAAKLAPRWNQIGNR